VFAAGLAALVGLAGAADPISPGPDLGMVRPYDVRLEKASDGRRLLRYTSQIANVGDAALRLEGSNRDASGRLQQVVQRLPDGSTAALATTMVFSGDGHNHWHVMNLEVGELIRLDNGVKVGTLRKNGFCFYDTHSYRLSLPGAPSSPQYTTCGTSSGATSVNMGLSVGWSDVYPAGIAYQWIDVTGLTPGRYRLQIGVNGALGIRERRSDNNSSWADIQLKSNSVRVVATGPSI
jgi:hypothetical protein